MAEFTLEEVYAAPKVQPKPVVDPRLVKALVPSAAAPAGSVPNVSLSPKDQRSLNVAEANRRADEQKKIAEENRATARKLEEDKRKEANPTSSMNESERTAGFLLQRLDFAEKQLKDTLQKNPSAAKPSYLAKKLENIDEDAANLITSAARQQIETAQYEILDTALTLGTGASYTPQQIKNYAKSYFTQIGDEPDVIKDKEARLANVVSAAKIKAGRAAQLIPEAKVGNKPPTGAPPDAKQAPDGKWYSPDPARKGKYLQWGD